ncbi:thioredoxin family protein [Ornithinibacillus gellani]|uniref:thioredoxin family protein n=1 Tax=Ornithinibacillus gellani TaxID=2293253 RepID=UPI000F489F2D|nr:thioredoxin family protein [Ornithinibacillus gellani]TQS75430.1 thioredoxin family protein [Ornithinibacillus gellani]
MEALQSLDQLEQLQQSKQPVILMFTADWCPDCRVIEPFLPELEEQYTTYKFISVDRDDFIEVCQEHDVFGIPSFIAFQDGKEIGRFVSKLRKSKEEITDFLDSLSNQS